MKKSYQWGEDGWRYGKEKNPKEQNMPTAAQGTQGVHSLKAHTQVIFIILLGYFKMCLY